jgi:hypothetical protein
MASEYTFQDPDGNEVTIGPVHVDAHPLVYFVPSSFEYRESTHDEESITDWYYHENGGHLKVERLFMVFEGDKPLDGYTALADKAKEVPTCKVRPARLQSGFNMISYEEPSTEGELLVRRCCELCCAKGLELTVVLFSSTLHMDDLNRPDVNFYARVIKDYARMTHFAE